MLISDGVAKTTLDNGLTVLLKEAHHAPVVAIVTYVKAGYFNESDDVAGISHLIEHMFFKGTKRRGVGDIARETKALGGYLNASTIYDHTLYYTVLPSRRFVEGLDLQGDALMYSVFDPDELKKETEVVIQEAKRKLDMPAAVAREKLFELAFDRHRIRRWRIGTEEGLRSFCREDFLLFYKNHYRPENIILTVAGDIEIDAAMREIERVYGSFEKGQCRKENSPAEPTQQRFKHIRLTGDITQAYLNIAFHAPPILHADSYALEVLAFILGRGRSSRLYQTLKQQSELVNSVSAYCYSLEDIGVFTLELNLKPDNVRESEIRIADILSHLQSHLIKEDELQRARNILESMYVASMGTASGLASVLASYQALGDYTLTETYMQKLAKVTAEDIRRVACEYLFLENSSLLEYVPTTDQAPPFAPDHWPLPGKNTLSQPDQPVSSLPDTTPVLASVGGRRSKRKPTAVERIMLPGGMRLLHEYNASLPWVTGGIFADGGRSRENGQTAGLSGLCLRTALRGTRNRTAEQLAKEIETLGTSIQVSNDPDYMSFSLNVLSKNFHKALAILADVIAEPAFDDSELHKEKENTLNAIQQEKDDMLRYPFLLFYQKLFGTHAYGLPEKGTPETIRGFERDDLLNWYQPQFTPRNLTISLVGDIERQEAIELVQKHFSGASAVKTVDRLNQDIVYPASTDEIVEVRHKAQTALVLGFGGPRYGHDDYYPLLVLQNAVSGLGGLFFEELRGRQSLAYTVSAFLVARRLGGTFLSYIATSPDKEHVARTALLAEFAKLRQSPIKPVDHSQSIEYTVGGFEIGLETNHARMVQYAHAELLSGSFEEVHAFPQKIRKVSAEETFRVARKYFDVDNHVVATVRGANS